MRRTLGLVTSIVAAATAMTLSAAPASATVHEIVGQACSGQPPLFPAGLTGGSSADNFAQPLFATGVIEKVSLIDGATFIDLNFDHPAIKLVQTSGYMPVGPNIFVSAHTLDPKFTNCKQLTS